MKLLPKLLAATSIFAATAAIAGPPVTVTFKNQATAEATYFYFVRFGITLMPQGFRPVFGRRIA